MLNMCCQKLLLAITGTVDNFFENEGSYKKVFYVFNLFSHDE